MSNYLLSGNDLQETIRIADELSELPHKESYNAQRNKAKKLGLDKRSFDEGYEWNYELIEQLGRGDQFSDIVSLHYLPNGSNVLDRHLPRTVDRASQLFGVESSTFDTPQQVKKDKSVAQLRLVGLVAGLRSTTLRNVEDRRGRLITGLPHTKQIITGHRDLFTGYVKIRQSSTIQQGMQLESPMIRRIEANLSTHLSSSEEQIE